MEFQIRKCDHCQLRYPLAAGQAEEDICPACRHPSRRVAVFPRWGVRRARPSGAPLEAALLDNIRSTWNVGAMFRTADGAGLRHLYLCGYTPTPEHPKVGKTALGAQRALTWSRHPDGVELARALHAEGKRLIALEATAQAEPLPAPAQPGERAALVLVVGNELAGVDPGLLELCDRVVSLPMAGVKESLNAAVAFGIAVYFLRYS